MVNIRNSIKIILFKTRFKCFEDNKWLNFYLSLDLNALNTENDLIFFIILIKIMKFNLIACSEAHVLLSHSFSSLVLAHIDNLHWFHQHNTHLNHNHFHLQRRGFSLQVGLQKHEIPEHHHCQQLICQTGARFLKNLRCNPRRNLVLT